MKAKQNKYQVVAVSLAVVALLLSFFNFLVECQPPCLLIISLSISPHFQTLLEEVFQSNKCAFPSLSITNKSILPDTLSMFLSGNFAFNASRIESGIFLDNISNSG